ncbi:MAG: uracil-DNA glycosylase [Victivallales bacterium]|nr:uracil-DNA glycosylase [Victivallales bacterium]
MIPPATLAAMDINALLAAARGCRGCPLHANRRNLVFGAGSPDADLMFIGEGPGREEDRQGVPFVGEAGQLLTKMINAMCFSRSEVYIANIVKCRPPNNRAPDDDEADACLPFLRRQIELVRPKVIVLLGAVALKYLMGVGGITRARGKWLNYNGIKAMPTFHPAYLLRNPQAKKDVWEDLQKVMALFGKTRSPISGR